jgi:tetratricopeptide (TPR) repeat protein
MAYKVLKRAVLPLAVVMSSLGAVPAMAQLEQSDCATLDGEAASACRDALEDNAGPGVFLRLGELLLKERDFFRAVKVYRRGVRLHQDNTELQAKLTVAESGLDEAQWIELRRQEAAARAEENVRVEIFKCTRLAQSAPNTALPACETAIAAIPDDPALLEAKGDALRATGMEAEAYLAYDAAARRASSPALEGKLAELAQYRPKPAPTPVAEANSGAPDTDENGTVQTAAATTMPVESDDPSNGLNGVEEQNRDDRAALIDTMNDPSKSLGERLEARNTLMSMARLAGDSG